MEDQIYTQEYKPNKLAFKAAIAYTVYFLVLMYVFKFLGIDQNSQTITVTERIISSVLSYIPFILSVVYVQTNYKKELGGYISFGKAFSGGFKVAAYTGLFVALILLIYYLVLDTGAKEEIFNAAIQAAGDDENKIKGVEMMRSSMVYFIGFAAGVTYTFFGLIVSLIGAAIIKKERPMYEEAK
ncbi:MAG TPA: DUF4199 domain-containing protein [Pedobacter sp.]|nr:DUF4199 domain-containing protein [Pedobacter sp.]